MARLALVLTLLQLAASAATFLQQVFIARVLGATEQTDGYQIALAIVLFLLQGVVMGALVNAFVPHLARLAREDVGGARHYSFWAQLNMFVAASFGTILLWIVAPDVVSWTTSGLSPAARSWAVESLRIMVVATPLVAISGVYASALYASGDLKYVAVAQLAQNTIAALFSVVGYIAIGFVALPISLVLGAAVACLALLGRLHGLSLTPRLQLRHARVSSGSIFRSLAGPLAAPLLAAASGFVERWFMSYFPAGQIAILAYGGRVFSVALAFGVSVGVVGLSQWSRSLGGQVGEAVSETSRSAVVAVLFTSVAGTVALVMMSDVVVQTLFGGSAMDHSQLALMAITLSIYGVGLIPTALLGVVMRGFYAAQEPKSAFGATAIWVSLWFVLDVAWVPPFGIYGLAAASVVAVWLTLAIVLLLWRREPWLSVWPSVIVSRETLTVVLASVVSVGVTAAAFHQLGPVWGLAATPFMVAAFVALAAAGGSTIARAAIRVLEHRARLR